MTTNLINETQAVYDGICAVAAACDGALEQDGVGFNGQDTKFGRRIASVPLSDWTPDVIREAARIATTYRKQILSATGVDVTTLDLVKATEGFLTNRVARDVARGFERQGLKANRKVMLLDGTLRFSWDSKDPECFNTLLAEVKRLPGRRWTGNFNDASISAEAVEFIERHAIRTVDFSLEDLRDRLVPAQAPLAAPEAPKAQPAQVRLEGDVVRLSFPYDPAAVSAVRNLPGRKYHGDTKTNTVHLSHDVLRFAEQFNLVVDPAVVEALKGQEDDGAAEAAREALFAQVSGSADPSALPAEFLAQVLAACPRAVVL